MRSIILALALTLATQVAAASDNLSLNIKVVKDGETLADNTLSAVYGEQSSFRLGRNIEYTGSAQIEHNSKKGPGTVIEKKATVFDGMEIKVTPTESSNPSSEGVYLLTEANISKVLRINEFSSGGAKIQQPVVDAFATKQKVRVAFGSAQVLKGQSGNASYEVEITPALAGE
ncbi:hypothetical protein LMG667_19755 [Xanthomonas euvesicatoria]|uniref:hypothetical protein n=1 Tax=Xanthomonas euvesicatoria TaxID=456327 RepID=UPI00080DB542|nr:hypothetical protein [Xanthomonas euvesicatoria]OCG82132.1 hypothetical protein LMG667_19755 [Xanthomonas euvesicatoria]